MLSDAIEKILSLTRPEMLDIGGKVFSRSDWTAANNESFVQPFEIHTLTGMIDWLQTPDVKPGMIHVLNWEEVNFSGFLTDKWNQRHTYVSSTVMPTKRFPFGQQMEIEDFVVMIRSRFVSTAESTRLLSVVSSISQSQVINSSDDGVSQSVVAKDEIGRDERIDFDGSVYLRPFRTFPEIEQPRSLFYLRLTQQKGKLPLVALHEADGGQWKITAINSIRQWISSMLDERHINAVDIVG